LHEQHEEEEKEIEQPEDRIMGCHCHRLPLGCRAVYSSRLALKIRRKKIGCQLRSTAAWAPTD
jgi:hypothetical protein